MAITLNGSTGITTPTYGGAVAAEYIAPVTSFKNRIINGAMVIDQRNAGAAVTVSGATGVYTVDRMFVRPNSSTNTSVVRSTDAPTGFQNSLQVTRVSGQTGNLTRVQTALETFNMVDLRGGPVTLSFYAKADSGYTPSGSALAVTLFAGNGTERARSITNYDNQSTPISQNVTLTTSWQKFTITSTNLPSDLSQLTVEFAPNWVGTAPSNDGFYITGVQLEKGSNATSFDYRPFGQELALCQRYYETGGLNATGYGNGSNGVVFSYPMKVTKRGTPTGTITSAGYINFPSPLFTADNADTVYLSQGAASSTGYVRVILVFNISSEL
jgi:hypothetical protein